LFNDASVNAFIAKITNPIFEISDNQISFDLLAFLKAIKSKQKNKLMPIMPY
jgi:hypothetical protein